MNHKGDLYLRLLFGKQLYHANRCEDAIKLFLTILSDYPDSLETHYNTALVYMKMNDYLNAIKHLLFITNIMDAESESFQADVWSLLGICYSQNQDFQAGLDAFKKAAAINPSFRSREIFYLKKCIQGSTILLPELYHEIGDCYLEMGNDFQAEKAYRKALEFGSDQTAAAEALELVNERINRTKKRIESTNYEILWQSPLFDSSGYAEEQKHFLDGIRPFPLKVKIHPMDRMPSLDLYPSDMKTYLLTLQKQQIQSPLIHYQAAPASFFSFPNAPISIGRTMFETDSLPATWVDILNEMTEVWVPSEFNRETFASAGVKLERMKIIPSPLDENKYDPHKVLPYPLKETASFKFLSVFDWSIRKGWEILLRAYFEEFKEDEDVSLILKVSKINEPNSNPYMKIKELTKKLGLTKLPRVHIIQETLSQEDMTRLYAAVDCFVLPSRGEGWGRPYMEAMAMELPTIGTKWSGQQAFMNEDNSYLINIEGLIPVDANNMPAHFHGHQWAEPSVDHLKSLMRHVYNHPEKAKQKGIKARKDLFPRFSNMTIGQQIYQRMDELVKYYYK
ncbi:glycosyl transferase family 2 protein [Bacillus methanolicus PB1]|uniref:Glycosyl transferase family 2 protein n=1 Tax=Bacillus methanolicus PB1 TaxID=997296 RepID=I3E4C6_BACMT|nr:glycosyltransferase [Bacillus methanolicus]EIJ81347.1 glycosyl transferase family 2 protein [Bacillus methanolicus PB1]